MSEQSADKPYVVALTGASGAIYAVRLLESLVAAGKEVHVTVSRSAQIVLKQELDIDLCLEEPNLRSLASSRFEPPNVPCGQQPGKLRYHHHMNFMAPIASGSFLTAGMAVCPCSGSTLSAIANASGNNLVQRAADVHLKERRPLILVPRETPLSAAQLENMCRASQHGAVILPAMPGWYHGVNSLQDLVDFVVSRILDQLRIPHSLMKRWGQSNA